MLICFLREDWKKERERGCLMQSARVLATRDMSSGLVFKSSENIYLVLICGRGFYIDAKKLDEENFFEE